MSIRSWGAWVAFVGVVALGHAHVQAQSGTMEELIAPLADGADAALAQGHPELATARATLVVASVAPSSPLVPRMQGVIDAAGGLVAASGDDPTEALAPMLDAAEEDLAGGRSPLGMARRAFVLERAPASGAIRERALALGSTVEPDVRPVASEPPVPPVPTRVPPASTTASDAPTTSPPDPTRRGDGELVELYVTATTFGVYTGFWIPFGAGLQGGENRNPESLLYSVSVLAGGALFALGVAGLDSGAGLRTGIAPAISASLRYGVALGFLMWGVLDPYLSPNEHCDTATYTCAENRAGLAERTSLPLAFGATGALVGLGVGLGLRPSTEQVRAVEIGGLWGGAIGLLSALGAAQDSSAGFAITATGVGLGLLGTAAAAGMGVRLGGRRLGFMTLGLAAGAAAGLLVPAFGSIGTHGWSWPLFSVTGATGLAGLVIAGLLTNGMDDAPAAGPAVHVSFGPTEGGGLATVSGTF